MASQNSLPASVLQSYSPARLRECHRTLVVASLPTIEFVTINLRLSLR